MTIPTPQQTREDDPHIGLSVATPVPAESSSSPRTGACRACSADTAAGPVQHSVDRAVGRLGSGAYEVGVSGAVDAFVRARKSGSQDFWPYRRKAGRVRINRRSKQRTLTYSYGAHHGHSDETCTYDRD